MRPTRESHLTTLQSRAKTSTELDEFRKVESTPALRGNTYARRERPPSGRDAVRIHFQERPLDLVVAIGYTLVMASGLLLSDIGNLLSLAGWKGYSLLDKALTIALALSVAIAAGTLAYVFLAPRPGETFTEFYILGPGGNASGYPTNLTRSQPGTVIIGVINHEAATVAYTARVDLVGVSIVFNVTCSCNRTQELNRTALNWFNQTIGDGQNWTQRYTFVINTTGLWEVQFLLYRSNNLTNVYRELHLFVRVS